MSTQFDAEIFIELLKTDLVAAVKQLVAQGSVEDLVEVQWVPNEIEHRVILTKVNKGNNGDGNEAWCTLKVELDNKHLGFIRFDGWYSSWDATEWDSTPTLVHPRRVVSTEYIAVDGSEDNRFEEILP